MLQYYSNIVLLLLVSKLLAITEKSFCFQKRNKIRLWVFWTNYFEYRKIFSNVFSKHKTTPPNRYF